MKFKNMTRRNLKKAAVSIETILVSATILVIASVVVLTLTARMGTVNEGASDRIDIASDILNEANKEYEESE